MPVDNIYHVTVGVSDNQGHFGEMPISIAVTDKPDTALDLPVPKKIKIEGIPLAVRSSSPESTAKSAIGAGVVALNIELQWGFSSVDFEQLMYFYKTANDGRHLFKYPALQEQLGLSGCYFLFMAIPSRELSGHNAVVSSVKLRAFGIASEAVDFNACPLNDAIVSQAGNNHIIEYLGGHAESIGVFYGRQYMTELTWNVPLELLRSWVWFYHVALSGGSGAFTPPWLNKIVSDIDGAIVRFSGGYKITVSNGRAEIKSGVWVTYEI